MALLHALNDDRLCVLLCRKSRGDSDSDLDRHEARLREIAAKRGFTVGKVIKEIVSGGASLDERTDLDELRAYIETAKPYAVLIVDDSRLGRDVGVVDATIKLLKSKQVRLFVGDQERDFSSMGAKAMTQIQSVFSEVELDQIRRRLFMGRMDSAKAGKHASGKAAFGFRYDRNDRKLYRDEAVAEVVASIFSDFSEGVSVLEIAERLTLTGVPLPSAGTKVKNNVGVWTKLMIKRILTNPVYCGYIEFNTSSKLEEGDRWTDETVFTKAEHEGYIDYETWLSIQARLEKQPRFTNKRTIFPLSGLVRCKVCGNSMGQHQPVRPATESKYRRNNLRTKDEEFPIFVKMCNCRKTRGVDARLLLDELRKRAQAYLEEVKAEVQVKDAKPQEGLKDGLMKALADLKKEREQVLKQNAKGWLSDEETDEAMSRIMGQMKETQKRLDALTESTTTTETAQDKADRIRSSITALLDESLSWADLNSVAKKLVKAIRYTRTGEGLDEVLVVEIEWR